MKEYCPICNEELGDDVQTVTHPKCWLDKNEHITSESKPHHQRLYLAFYCGANKTLPHLVASQHGIKLKHASEYEDGWGITSQMWDMEIEGVTAIMKAIGR